MAKIVLALGGNALQDSSAFTAEAQTKIAAKTAVQIVDLVELGHELVIVHGNGPQVGDILLGEEASVSPTNARMPLDVCVAMSQGQIGYWLQQTIGDELKKRGIDRPVVTIVTQIVVDPHDPAFENPTKPIGTFYDQSEAEKLSQTSGWVIKEDAGRGWRRVVPSPQPVRIVEINTIKTLLDQGIITITIGGGGIPVLDQNTDLVGIEAVVDKDFAAAKLAEDIGADVLMILTAVDNVAINYQSPAEQPLQQTNTQQIEKYIEQNQFAPGSMLPKVEAAVSFVRHHPERIAIITSLDKAKLALQESAGTIIYNYN